MNGNSVTCLVVDDEPAVREVVARVLDGAGYRTLQAGSGAEALRLLEREHERVELVISDLQMPGMDGAALLRQVQRRWPELGTVIVTGVAELTTAVELLQAGAYDYITKPFGIDEVVARVRQALDKKRLVTENRRYQMHLAELVRQQASRIEELFLEAVQTLVEALEAKDPYTRGHSARVSSYAAATARALGLPEGEVHLIQLGAELHDVGKIGVRESVLLKPAALSDEEYRHIMSHTVVGAAILSPLFKNAPDALAIVRSHHERMDGRGFPDGLSGDRIPISARVVTVADAFDAMTSGRTYRSARGSREALDEVRAGAGTQFDPDVVAAFLRAHDRAGVRLPIETPQIRRRHLPLGIAFAPAGTGKLPAA
ncbi:MAG: response regulator [Gemmatimonadetes bacterium]|nr:response regulator [Gemmatimonadota bacterium]